jgi:4a-hydroxytetrahydrobiopterin dehydratase
MELLGENELGAALASLPDWSGNTGGLRRVVAAPDFLAAIRIVDDVAVVAEALNHHPDIDIRWRDITFTLSTHSKGGVTERDLELARRIDEVVKRQTAG